MGRFSADQNKVALLYESGLYGMPTGVTAQWLGQITNHDVRENENVIPLRHIGTASRNVDSFVAGPLEVDGTVTYRPQDFRGLGLFLGSIVTVSNASASKHDYSEVSNGARLSAFTSGTLNPFISFQLEDSKTVSTGSNFVRTVKGCNANTFDMTIEPGTPVEIELGYIAQNVAFSSGASTAMTAATTRPFLWGDCTVQLPAGTTLEAVKRATFRGENGITQSQYVGSGRNTDVPAPLGRDYTVEITKDMTAETAKILYDQYYKGGSEFHIVLDVNADLSAPGIGSRHMILTLSGCRITEMTSPSIVEGLQEQTFTTKPKSASAIEYTGSATKVPW